MIVASDWRKCPTPKKNANVMAGCFRAVFDGSYTD